MGGGLMQLVAYGTQDIYLTGNPQITFFKVVYRRHTNFSIEAIQQTLNGTANQDSTQTCTVSRNGDLVTNVWMEDPCSNAKTAAEGEIYNYINRIDCEIGGQLIDRQTGDWNAIWWNLTTPASKTDSFRNAFVGYSGTSVNDRMCYPFNFWFCRNVGLALPLIALQYHEVKFQISYGSSSAVSNNVELWIDYIYLDTDERRRFAQVSHEYLIEQVQRETFLGNKKKLKLHFNHPVKELIWVNDVQASGNEGTTSFGPIRTTSNVVTPIAIANSYADSDNTFMRLVLNGHDRFAKRRMKYFKTCQPLQYHTRCPAVGKRSTISVNIGISTVTTGTAIHYVDKPVRIIKAYYSTLSTQASPTGNFKLAISDGVAAPAAFSGGVSYDITETTNWAAIRTNGAFSFKTTFNDDGTSLCIPAGKSIGIITSAVQTPLSQAQKDSGAWNDAVAIDGTEPSYTLNLRNVMVGQLIVTLELEELPVLIGGNPITSGSADLGNIYCYSFALKPEEHQPSGTCNFSRIDNAEIIFDNDPGDADTITKVFAVNYNVLRIMSGMGGLAYSN